MKNVAFRMTILTAGLLVVSCAMWAHHGSHISYDMGRKITLVGTVTEFVWSNPHSQIYFDVTDEKGNVAHWGAETTTPAMLKKSGWTKDSMKPGDKITVTVWPSKVGTSRGFLAEIVLPNGEDKKLGATE